MNLSERISDYTKKKFESWEVTEQIIDENKAFYMLKMPSSEYQKVCMFRDGKDMIIYGDYGRYVFDNMTWLATPHNLQYDNLGYQMEKMDRDSRESAFEFDEETFENDLREWVKYRLCEHYEVEKEKAEQLIDLAVAGCGFSYSEVEEQLSKFSNKNIDSIVSLLDFANDAFPYASEDQIAWVSFLRDNSDRLCEHDEVGESNLWRAGQKLSPNFLVSLYAMRVCSEKLQEKNYGVFLEIKDQLSSNSDLVITCKNEDEACAFLQFLNAACYRWPFRSKLHIDTEALGANAYFLNGPIVTFLHPQTSSNDLLCGKRAVPYSDIEEFVQEWMQEHLKDSPSLEERD